MQRYQNVAQDAQGNIIQAMNASVFLKGTQTLAALFSDSAGTLPITNPVVTDFLGNFAFYAANGRYDIQLSKANLPTSILPDVLLFDPFGGGGGALAPAQILFGGPANAIAQDPNFFWDNVNERLNVGAGGAALDTRLILNGGTNAVKGALINFQRGGVSQGFFGTSDLILGDAAGNLAIQCVADLKISRGNSTIPAFNTTSSGVAVNGASTGTLTVNGGMTQNYDSAGVNSFIQNDTNAAGASWITGPGSGSGSRGDYNIFNSTANQLALRINKTTGVVTVLNTLAAPSNVNTPSVGNESGTTSLRANGATAIQFSSSGFNPNADLSMSLGLGSLRYLSVVTTTVDSGNTAPLFLKCNAVTTLQLQTNISAVNFFSMAATPAGTQPQVASLPSSDANVGMDLIAKGSGAFNFFTRGDVASKQQFAVVDTASSTRWPTATGSNGGQPQLSSSAGNGLGVQGTNTNDSAAAGNYGEYVEAAVGSGSAVALTTNVAANVTSITLGAGDWDVRGTILYKFAATTSYTRAQSNLTQTSATPDGISGHYVDFETAATVPNPAATDPAWGIPPARFSLSGSTTIFLVALATFTVSTLSAYGRISARRVR